MEDSNRYRVSRDFTFVNILTGLALLLALGNLINDVLNQSITIKSGIVLTIATIVLSGLIVYINTRDIIEYDDRNKVLYIVNSRNPHGTQIPVINIEKILFSMIGVGKGSHSYLIIYKDHNNTKQKIRLFPVPLSNDINKIINDTKLENPNLITRNWSLGVNEFFD